MHAGRPRRNATNATNETNVTREVIYVEPAPAVESLSNEEPAKLDHRFHQNETDLYAEASAYCSKFFCESEHTSEFACRNCQGRLNSSLVHGMLECRVGCEMDATDKVTEESVVCESSCLHLEMDKATCRMECDAVLAQDCHSQCEAKKSAARAAGEEIKPFFWPEPVTNSSNSTNSSNASAA